MRINAAWREREATSRSLGKAYLKDLHGKNDSLNWSTLPPLPFLPLPSFSSFDASSGLSSLRSFGSLSSRLSRSLPLLSLVALPPLTQSPNTGDIQYRANPTGGKVYGVIRLKEASLVGVRALFSPLRSLPPSPLSS